MNSEGKKTTRGADMETQTPFLELEMAPKQTRPTNQEAHYLQSRCMINRPNKNYHRSEKLVSITPNPPRKCVKNRIFLTGQSIAACLPNKICTGENRVTSSTEKYPIRLNVCCKLKASAFGPNVNLTDPHYNARFATRKKR